MGRVATALLGVTVVVLSTLSSGPAPEADATPSFVVPRIPGQTSTVPGWRLQSSAVLTETGGAISDPAYDDDTWYRVPARSTVMAGLIANNRYPDLNFSTNLRDAVNPADFAVPWWYRTEFVATGARPGTHTFLELNGGIIARGEIWLNGTRLPGTEGAYPRYRIDVTELLRPGRNAIAVEAKPGDPFKDFTISFLDWSPPAPDNNMGIWRDVSLTSAGVVSLDNPRVLTALELPGMTYADLTVKAELRNNTSRPVDATVHGAVGGMRFQQQVSLSAGETRTVTFDPLRIQNPRVWWPAQFGGQPLYRLDMVALSEGFSDLATTSFGIRDARSELTPQGYRKFYVNGKPFGVRGGGWASDLFLRTLPGRLADEMRIARDLGLNTLRLEGKNEDREFADLADRLGIMLLPGWECCTKWEKYSTWTDADHRTAYESTKAEAERFVNHPSVLGFFIGSDGAAPARAEQTYLDALRAADFTAPILPSAAARTTPQLGRSGMKMDGPYWWIPPAYWYQDRLGGSDGFASEIGPGPSISETDSLRRFLTDQEIEDLWSKPEQPHYHMAKKEVFSKLSVFSAALANRYGAPADLNDFQRKAQLANYEISRAQLEAYGRDFSDPVNPSTGVIYWMANNAWPTQYFNLWDHNLATAGTFFGAKKALRPLHVQFSYDDRSVVLANTGLNAVDDLTVRATAFGLDGTVLSDQTAAGVTAVANASERMLTLPEPAISGTYLVRLLLSDSQGRKIDRNVYWLSTKPDVLDFTKSTWWYTPTTSYADLTGLQGLPSATVERQVRTTPLDRNRLRTDVTLTNTSNTVALAVRVNLQGVLPVLWSDNYVTLWPGESTTLQAEYRHSGAAPLVLVKGFNVE